jgi:predicted helicase
MASYAMAHLKLDMLLTETGYIPTKDQRLKVFLTNSLEEPNPDSGTLWGNLLSDEADQANEVKRDTPVMCVIGNPPYSGESSNKGEWIMRLMEDYKKEPGGKLKLQERNPKWINDDYVKFLRYGQYYIEKNGQGILAFINPHGYLDNPTFRGMRWNLLETYDSIYTIDLHGNAKKKETAPDGGADINVFDIEQGVSINVFVKTGKKKPNELAKVFHYDLYGKREFKYDFLSEKHIRSIDFKKLPNIAPNYFFIGKDFSAQRDYENGFKLTDFFPLNSVGIVTAKDSVLIKDTRRELKESVEQFYNIKADENFIRSVSYRPFDEKFVYYDVKLVERAREKLMQHFFGERNLGITLCKQFKTGERYQHALISDKIIESCFVSNRTSEITSIFPLYLYPKAIGQHSISQVSDRQPNLDIGTVNQISEKLGLTLTNEKETTKGTFAPIDILDYIYGVLHSPSYREKYKEFLKIDFPRIPYPKDKDTFWKLVRLGGEIRQVHLLESPLVDKPISKYPITGTNIVGKIKYEDGRVFINDTQYFEDVPEVSWNFYIGGYQPAQKWLKDRKDRELQVEDIRHYLKIVVALIETDRLMKEIDKVEIE